MTLRRRGIPTLRIQTYKSNQQALRSYYKYVCKEGLFTNLVNGTREALPNPYCYDGFFFSGYPLYEASRSRTRDRWERIGNARLDELHKTEEEKRWALVMEMRQEEERRSTEFIKLLHGTGITIFDSCRELGWDMNGVGRDLLEAQALFLAIKQHIKTTTVTTRNGQHQRTKRLTVQPVQVPKGRNNNRTGGNRNDKRSRKGSPLR